MATKIIINADDCGISRYVNAEIESCILSGKITSATIMANMDDFEGAVGLYKKYHEQISFGWHMNLTEGEPLLKSQLLLDKGYFVDRDGKLEFNTNDFRNKLPSKSVWCELKKELVAQYEKLRDSGVQITHADSHQYIHTSPGLGLLIPSFLRELKIDRCRRVENYGFSTKSYLARQLWTATFKMRGLRLPDTFTFFINYYDNATLKQGETIELMIHPGHAKTPYKEEYETMLQADYAKLWPNATLINYKQI